MLTLDQGITKAVETKERKYMNIMQQHSKNLKLAEELLPQIENMITEFVNENLDHSKDDVMQQQEDILIYVKENLYDWFD